ncbi:hypothetical protein L484_010229 [Morus notabilis]|uniref:Coiled-coil domain-containing protein SCD2 n=1 Tax=Morus notabilis TaxID=981085 RepID=W9R4E3_9ROSA|nr:hypothetical protein L484_010229 [Morus notabilis]
MILKIRSLDLREAFGSFLNGLTIQEALAKTAYPSLHCITKIEAIYLAMDRTRQVYAKQNSNTGTPVTPSSPMASPLNRHTRMGSTTGLANARKAQNAKAAAQRLAHVMAHQAADEDDEEDDLLYDYGGTRSLGLGGGRAIRSRSPMSLRCVNNQDQSSSTRAVPGPRSSSSSLNNLEKVSSSPQSSSSGLSTSASGTRLLQSINSVEQPQSAYSVAPNIRRLQSPNSSGQSPSSYSATATRTSQQNNPNEQPKSARSTTSLRLSSQSSIEQPPSARSSLVSLPHLGIKTVSMVPASVPISLKPPSPAISSDVHVAREKRLSLDLSMNLRETGNQRSSSVLQDELDMLQEENESLLEKLRLAEERCEDAEARGRQLEKQVATLGEGVTLEARLLSRHASSTSADFLNCVLFYANFLLLFVLLFRKEAALQQREAALRVAEQTARNGLNSEIITLRTEAETARDEATSALENLHEAERELKSLQIATQRMILTKEEMEEVVLKRCWLARYWSLCVEHGIHAEIAKARYEYWSSLAPLPVEVVLSAGQKAKEEKKDNDLEEIESDPRDLNKLSGDVNIENMLLVEKGMRELASLKVEDAVALAMALSRRLNAIRSGLSAYGCVDDLKLPIEGQFEAFELSKEESDDVLFKQAWLTYFWRRAKNHGLEPDVSEERLEFWVNHNTKPPTSHDAVDVERGLIELRKFGIENQLWEESRKELELDTNRKRQSQSDF